MTVTNTITYTAHGDDAKKIKRSKIGVVVHQKYSDDMKHASPHVDHQNFKEHPDVHIHGAEHDTSKVHHSAENEKEFNKHMKAAKDIHDTHGHKMYDAVHHAHGGETGHLSTYINHTVRHDEVPHVKGFQAHLYSQHEKMANKVKTPKAKTEKRTEGEHQIKHVEKNKSAYGHLFSMHHHLHQAKNALVKSLETHEGKYEHHIEGKKSKPEGFVVNHKPEGGREEPTKLVNRAEFAKANLLKVRK